MKVHTTNYTNTFIEVSADCPALCGEPPPEKMDKKTVANLHFAMIKKHPYRYTSDEVIFQTFAHKNDLTEQEYKKAWNEFFSKGQACMRTSPLTKRYGWGLHADEKGRIAIYGRETKEYKKFVNDKNLTVVKAMKTSR